MEGGCVHTYKEDNNLLQEDFALEPCDHGILQFYHDADKGLFFGSFAKPLILGIGEERYC